MKKIIKIRTFLAISCFLFYMQPLQADTSSAGVVNAINAMKKAVTSALQGSSNINIVNQLKAMNTQTTRLFDDTFKGTFNSAGQLIKPSTVSLYIRNFYSWFTTKVFSGLDFSEKNKKNETAMRKLLAQQIGYSLQSSIEDKDKDARILLAKKIESAGNNINPEFLGLGKNPKLPPAYGSMNDDTPVSENAPNVLDLTGPDSYSSKEELDKAKLFIRYILESAPPPKTIYIPNKKEAVNNEVTIYLPKASEDYPYTPVTVSTKPLLTGLRIKSEYDIMKAFLDKDTKYYQPYKMKTRTANILRTVYLDSIIRPYQERLKDPSKNGQSLVEKERAEALRGLDQKYYDDLKNKSMADVNLETLRAINKLAYFLYKVHEDNVRNSLVLSTSSLQLVGQGGGEDETKYINPISTMIEKRCWKPTDETKTICDNPIVGASPSI